MKRKNLRRTLVYLDYYTRLKNIALSAFKWENLPDTCNERFLEETLFHYGRAVFVKDPYMSFLNLKVNASDILNVYNEPKSYHAFGVGYSKHYDAEKCVYIRNNYQQTPTDTTIMLFAERLAKIEIAIETNINAQRTPVLVRCDEKTRTSLTAVYDQYEGDKPVIFGTKALQEKPLEVLTTGAPYVSDKLREDKRAVWNEALEFLGINTNPSDKKKERLIVSEVDSNNEQIDIQAETMLLCREKACEEINKMFGLNVSVSRRVHNVGAAPHVDESEVLDVG